MKAFTSILLVLYAMCLLGSIYTKNISAIFGWGCALSQGLIVYSKERK